MSDQKTNLVPVVAGVVVGAFALLSSFLGGPMLPSLVLSLSLLAFGTSIYMENRAGRIALGAVSSILFLVSELFRNLGAGAPILSLATMTMALSAPLAVLPVVVAKRSGKKVISTMLSAVVVVASLASAPSFTRSYIYLYMDGVDYGRVELFLRLVQFSAFLAVFAESVSKEKRSPYAVFFLLSTACAATALSFFLNGSGIFSTASSMGGAYLSVLAFVSYLSESRRDRKGYDGHMVTFTDMVYQELKPSKRKAKARKYEIPPNVPVLRREVFAESEKNTPEN